MLEQDETSPDKTKERLRRLRDNFSDEIPSEVLHGQGDFKVRRNCWHKVVGGLVTGLKNGVISSELRSQVNEFLDH